MKKYIILILAVLCCLVFAACGCEHVWKNATCTEPQTCTLCGDTEGAALGHDYAAATCAEPKTCKLCAATEGTALGHKFSDATCTEARTCGDCGATEGDPLGHDWLDATTDAPKTCTVCAATEGDPVVTDSRFTTEKSKIVFGTWSADIAMPMEQVEPALAKYDARLECRATLHFKGDGTLTVTLQVQDNQVLRDALAAYTVDSLYNNMIALGIHQSSVEQKFQEMYGMPIQEYAAAKVAETPVGDIIENTRQEYVYYVTSGTLFVCTNWHGIMEGYTVAVHEGQLLLSPPQGDSVAFYEGE